MIKQKRYRGFCTIFNILPKIEKYLKDKGINPENIFYDSFTWYEILLFDRIDENKDGIPDEKFGKSFELVYYEIVEKWVNKKEVKFIEEYSYDKKKSLGGFSQVIHQGKKAIGIRSRLIVKSPI